jgi:hypothetical protein
VIDVIDQLLFHFIGAILPQSLVDSITKSLPWFDRIDRSISTFQINALILIDFVEIASAVDVTVAVVAIEDVAPSSNHNCVFFEAFGAFRVSLYSSRKKEAVDKC